jgi:SAM-dependent methyltransferase
VQWAGLVPAGATVLDLAAGGGRHTRFFAERGHKVTAVDRDASLHRGRCQHPTGSGRSGDGSPWPLPGRTFGAAVVTNYLHRALMPALLGSIAPQGVLLYETFMVGNERFGRPTNPDFLLRDGELLDLVRGKFSVVAYEARMVSEPKIAMIQRIAARKL